MDEPGFLEEDYDEPRRKRWPVLVAIVVVLALLLTYGASELLSTEVLPRVQTGGSADSFEFLQIEPTTGDPVRYNPCREIHYVINPRLAHEGGVADVRRGFETIGDAAGLTFVYDGPTDEDVRFERPAYQPDRYGRDWAPILVGWVPEEQMSPRDPHPAGSGGSVAVENARGRPVYVTGVITLNAEARLLPGYDVGATWGDLVLHELGHVVGLAHVDDDGQIMFESIQRGPGEFGRGDLTGLRRLGREAGCIAEPRPERDAPTR
ncbi:MAG: matrixin family metalloprotease [Actinomycetota bacterium]